MTFLTDENLEIDNIILGRMLQFQSVSVFKFQICLNFPKYKILNCISAKFIRDMKNYNGDYLKYKNKIARMT